MPSRKYEAMFSNTSRLTVRTQACLHRTIAVALKTQKTGSVPLLRAAVKAARELREQGLDLAAIVSVLGAVVEDAGRALGAARLSLFTREPLWLSVRRAVLAAVTTDSHEVDGFAFVG